MTTLQSKISVGGQVRTVAELLSSMRIAFSEDEVLRWAFCIQQAFLTLGYNADIDQEMKAIMKSKEVRPIVAQPDDNASANPDLPDVLVNYIFKESFTQEQLQKIWCWANDHVVSEITYPYQYLAFLLFLEHHQHLYLKNFTITNTDMETQMVSWFVQAKVKCSQDALGTYRNGFFNNNSFSYPAWVNSDGVPPDKYSYKKDQSRQGFMSLNRLCNDLEIHLSELKI